MKAVLNNRLMSAHVQLGVGLVEVLIALVVFALGVISMAQLQLRTMSLTMDSTQRSYVIAQSQNVADKIRSSGIAPVWYLGTYSDTGLFCDPPAPKECADSAIACTAAEMAVFELHDAFCVGDGSYDRQVSDWQVTIGCERPDAGGGMAATITCDELGAELFVESSWFARSFDDDISAADAGRDTMTLRFAP